MPNKKILILSSGYYPNLIGGAEVAIKEITDRLGDKYDFDMLTLRFDSTLAPFERIGKVNVYRLGFSSKSPKAKDLVKFPLYLNKVLFPILAACKFFRLDKDRHYDFIWAMMSYMGMAAVIIRMLKNVRFGMTLQEGDSFEHILERKRIRPFVFLIKKAFKDASIIQAISNYLGDWAVSMGGNNIAVVPNGVDIRQFENEGTQSLSGQKKIVTTSRLVRKNGVDILIKAMKYLPSEAELQIIGTGPEEQELRGLVRVEGLEKKVHFLGFVSQEKIPDYLRQAYVFARPSRSEGQGISFIEAMAAGVPVVATAVGGIPDFIEDKKTGLFCEEENPEDLARKINILMRDNEIRTNIVEHAAALVHEKYDWARIVKELDEKFFSKI
jgi:glycosyltransferase involved in cell wall biosynthesis